MILLVLASRVRSCSWLGVLLGGGGCDGRRGFEGVDWGGGDMVVRR